MALLERSRAFSKSPAAKAGLGVLKLAGGVFEEHADGLEEPWLEGLFALFGEGDELFRGLLVEADGGGASGKALGLGEVTGEELRAGLGEGFAAGGVVGAI